MKEVRGLIRSLSGQNGMTVFLSSHLLSEVELVATRMAVVNRGELIAQGGCLRPSRRRSLAHYSIEVSPLDPAIDLISRLPWVELVSARDRKLEVRLESGRSSELTGSLLRTAWRSLPSLPIGLWRTFFSRLPKESPRYETLLVRDLQDLQPLADLHRIRSHCRHRNLDGSGHESKRPRDPPPHDEILRAGFPHLWKYPQCLVYHRFYHEQPPCPHSLPDHPGGRGRGLKRSHFGHGQTSSDSASLTGQDYYRKVSQHPLLYGRSWSSFLESSASWPASSSSAAAT